MDQDRGARKTRAQSLALLLSSCVTVVRFKFLTLIFISKMVIKIRKLYFIGLLANQTGHVEWCLAHGLRGFYKAYRMMFCTQSAAGMMDRSY